MIGTISIEDVVKGVVVNGENVVDYDGIAKIIIPDPPEVPVKDVKVDGESVVDPQGDANIVIPVKDVKVDGESVIDSEGVANITIPDPPETPVKDVKVDGESVVNAQGVANITLPDPPDVPVKDVKVNGESVVNAQGVANVVVPVISNLRVVKQLPGVPAAVVTVSDAEAFTMPSLKVAVEAWQEGSGNPSPTNVRPISGWNEVNVTVADDVDNPTVEHTYTIDLDGTRYGGEVDVVNGVLTVNRAYVDLGSLSWSVIIAQNGVFGATVNGLKTYSYGNTPDMLCSVYKISPSSYNDPYISTNGIIWTYVGVSAIRIKDTAYSDATAFKTAMKGVQLVYELATPLTIQLTPTVVKSLEGDNNIFADSGKVLQGEYVSNINVVDIG